MAKRVRLAPIAVDRALAALATLVQASAKHANTPHGRNKLRAQCAALRTLAATAEVLGPPAPQESTAGFVQPLEPESDDEPSHGLDAEHEHELERPGASR